MMAEITVPAYYVVSRNIPVENVTHVVDALRITPIGIAIISNVLDAQLALRLSDELLRVESDEAARALALQISESTGSPSVVIGEAEFFDAVYSNGTSEAVVKEC